MLSRPGACAWRRLFSTVPGSLGARTLQLLEVRAGEVHPVSMTLAALREEAGVGLRELLQVERPLSSSTQPRILPRPMSTPFHLGAARGIILPTKVLLFTHPNLSSIPAADVASALAEQLSRPELHAQGSTYRISLTAAGAPATPPAAAFEFAALEALLWAMASRQEKRVAYVSRVLAATLHAPSEHAEDGDSPLLTLLPLSNTLSHYELVSRGLMQCVRALLDGEGGELQHLCRGGGAQERAQMEELLEAVHHSAAGTTLAAAEMTRQLSIKGDMLQLHQRAFQNSLLTYNLRLTQMCLAISGSMWTTSLFGQNLTSGLESLGQVAFFSASAASALVGGALLVGVRRLMSGVPPGSAGGGSAAASSSRHNPRRLESLQSFLLQLDVRLDAARSTLTAAAEELQRTGHGRLSKARFCQLHCQQTPGGAAAEREREAELLFDVLDSGRFEGYLSLADIRGLEHLMENVSLHTIRAGVSSHAGVGSVASAAAPAAAAAAQ
jgi:hypothetical protein